MAKADSHKLTEQWRDNMKMYELTEDNFDLTPQQRRVASLGRVLMDQAPKVKDDGLSNLMAKVGNELTNFGAVFGPRNMQDLLRKTGTTEEVLKKLLGYAQKLEKEAAALAADHKDGGLDDTNDDPDDFDSPDDDEIARQADMMARDKRD